MKLCCEQDDRREAVRSMKGRNGIDFVELGPNTRTLHVYFLGKLPPVLLKAGEKAGDYFRIEGGRRIRDLRITKATPVPDDNPEKDDFLILELDRAGDFSLYTVRIAGVADIDPRYDRAEFSFKIDCPSSLDCAPVCECKPSELPEPEINYLAKDYNSFRQLIFDRLAALMPDWKERHAADLGVMLVELLAYAGDHLSYYQDAVATEAYLDTARQRISVRRHTRLVDYHMHEGCNARAWLHIGVSTDFELVPEGVAFITGLNGMVAAQQTILTWDDLREAAPSSYEVFEPVTADPSAKVPLWAAHNEIRFYTWGEKECCLERGATSATLIDTWTGESGRALRLVTGDVLIFEEVRGAVTGLVADADPARRHAVRLTKVTTGEDPVFPTDGRPLPYVEVEWSAGDALPFPFCISAMGPAPDCAYIENISVARGNILLVDHGKTVGPDELGTVGAQRSRVDCDCEGVPGNAHVLPAVMRPHLARGPLTWRQSIRQGVAASGTLEQDPRAALPQVRLSSEPARDWTPHYDLLASGPADSHFVVEMDNDGVAHLRFGDGELGAKPPAGMSLSASYRVGNGKAGNVGAESISRIVFRNTRVSGVSLTIRNPLPARGGTEREPMNEAKLFAPRLFRKTIERAVIAADYEEIAERDPAIQNASAELVWTGSWHEADVAVDPLGAGQPGRRLLRSTERRLEQFRRMGHDLEVMPAQYVPIDLRLEVCALPYYERADVLAALLAAFSARALPDGRRGFFHPDNLTFGEGIFVSRIVAAAMAVPGVECVTVARLQRLFEPPNFELQNGVLLLRVFEIARLDGDPNYPERGLLEIDVKGGR